MAERHLQPAHLLMLRHYHHLPPPLRHRTQEYMLNSGDSSSRVSVHRLGVSRGPKILICRRCVSRPFWWFTCGTRCFIVPALALADIWCCAVQRQALANIRNCASSIFVRKAHQDGHLHQIRL